MAERVATSVPVQDSIREMVRRIAAQFHPDKIILFGSHARGQAGPDSDVDLLIVMPVKGSKRRKATEIDGALADRRIPLDLIVVTPEEFERARHQVGSVLRPAALEGLVLYDRAA
ncbi:nucleotidyltransferase domain-containing protein [Nitrospira moscoviensis]|jgi:predicted nucleotidyltransferase|uniref:DNA polymerase, beta-like region n=1 Tax=Nitrospira moscoviensis TaxID=42253 RepID=A0A0K2GBG3_NITMO|nr:nucleotidyltransferase domain-containing protein [Nitrospira moscoviensis]ALA58311.1 DNA polymerase, beta-like region [Nitrospira moscoviensis]